MLAAESVESPENVAAYYRRQFGLDEPPRSSHCNYLDSDGGEAHAFACTELMQPRSFHNDPNGLPRCVITTDSDGILR